MKNKLAGAFIIFLKEWDNKQILGVCKDNVNVVSHQLIPNDL